MTEGVRPRNGGGGDIFLPISAIIRNNGRGDEFSMRRGGGLVGVFRGVRIKRLL